jgi:hypothetical protein
MAAEQGKKGGLHNFIRLFPSVYNDGEEQIITLLHKEMAQRGRGYNSSHEQSEHVFYLRSYNHSSMPFTWALSGRVEDAASELTYGFIGGYLSTIPVIHLCTGKVRNVATLTVGSTKFYQKNFNLPTSIVVDNAKV